MTSGSSVRGSIADESSRMNRRALARRRLRLLPAAVALFAEDGQEVGPQVEVVDAATVPLAQHLAGGRVKARDPIQPGNAGVQGQVGGFRMVPADVRGQAAHRQRTSETAVDQQRTALV